MSIQEDLENIRSRIRLLKKLNKSLSEKCGNINIFNNNTNNLNVTNCTSVQRKFKENHSLSTEEKTANNCYKGSKEKLRKKIQKKKVVGSIRNENKNSKLDEMQVNNDSGQLLQKYSIEKQRTKMHGKKVVSCLLNETDSSKPDVTYKNNGCGQLLWKPSNEKQKKKMHKKEELNYSCNKNNNSKPNKVQVNKDSKQLLQKFSIEKRRTKVQGKKVVNCILNENDTPKPGAAHENNDCGQLRKCSNAKGRKKMCNKKKLNGLCNNNNSKPDEMQVNNDCRQLLQNCPIEKQKAKMQEKKVVSCILNVNDSSKSDAAHKNNDCGQLLQKCSKEKQKKKELNYSCIKNNNSKNANDSKIVLQRCSKGKKVKKKQIKESAYFYNKADNIKFLQSDLDTDSTKLACNIQNLSSIPNIVKTTVPVSSTNSSMKKTYLSQNVPQNEISIPLKNNTNHRTNVLFNNKSNSERNLIEKESNDIIYHETISCKHEGKNSNKNLLNGKVYSNRDYHTQNMHKFTEISFLHTDENNDIKNSKVLHSNGNNKLKKEKQNPRKCPSALKINMGSFVSEKSINVNKRSSSLFSIESCSVNENNCSLLSHEEDSTSNCQKTMELDDFVQIKDRNVILKMKKATNSTQINADEKKAFMNEWDFAEEPVDFTVPLLHLCKNGRKHSKKEIELLISKNVQIKKGKWEKEEEELLKRNFNNFICQFKISDVGLLFYKNLPDKSKHRNIKQFLKAKHFYVRLSKDLNTRLLHKIYMKARYLFYRSLVKIKCDKKDASILQLQKKYSNERELITPKNELPVASNKNTYKNSCLKGEVEKVFNAEQSVKAGKTSQSLKEIIGGKVAVQVGTCNDGQLYTKQNDCKPLFDSKLKYPKWNWRYSLELLRLLNDKFLVDAETNIDWNGINKHFKNVVPCESFLKQKFNEIKQNGPKELRKFHPYMTDFLLKKHKEKLENHFKLVF